MEEPSGEHRMEIRLFSSSGFGHPLCTAALHSRGDGRTPASPFYHVHMLLEAYIHDFASALCVTKGIARCDDETFSSALLLGQRA